MILIDSSGWLEYFTNGKNASIFSKTILDNKNNIIVPAIVLYEVFKKVLKDQGENIALQVIAQLRKFQIINLDEDIAISAAITSNKYNLAMADSIIYTIGLCFSAVIWTQDKDFKALSGVKFIPK